MDNLVLIGMPSSGKSTAGRVFAQKIGYTFLDCDTLIEQRGRKPLSALIEELGTEGFIRLEEEINTSLDVQNAVVATGGSVIYSPQAMARLKQIGFVVYLKTSKEEILSRIPSFTARGVVMRGNIGSLEELYDERTPLYERYADATVDCTNQSVKETVKAILELWERKRNNQ